MGMTVNMIEVYVLNSNNMELHWKMALDNEIKTKINLDKTLFASAKTIKDVVECIGKGFVESWWDESDGEEPINFIENYCEEFFCEDEYKSFKKKVNKFKFAELKKIVLLSNNEVNGCRSYQGVVQDFESKTINYSNTRAAFGKNYARNPEDCNPSSIEFIKTLL